MLAFRREQDPERLPLSVGLDLVDLAHECSAERSPCFSHRSGRRGRRPSLEIAVLEQLERRYGVELDRS